MILHTGSGRHKCILDVSANTLDEDLINALPSLHAIPGCDSASPVHGMGKIKWLNTIQKHDHYLSAMVSLVSDLVIEPSLFETIGELFCTLSGY